MPNCPSLESRGRNRNVSMLSLHCRRRRPYKDDISAITLLEQWVDGRRLHDHNPSSIAVSCCILLLLLYSSRSSCSSPFSLSSSLHVRHVIHPFSVDNCTPLTLTRPHSILRSLPALCIHLICCWCSGHWRRQRPGNIAAHSSKLGAGKQIHRFRL